jgi:hypothetical protein
MKQRTIRIICWIMAGLMLFGVLAMVIGIVG